MKFLVRKAPEHFIRTVNDEISSLLNRHFDSYFPEAAYWEDMDKYSMPVEMTDKGKEFMISTSIKNTLQLMLKKKKKQKLMKIPTKNQNSDTVNFQELFTSLKKLMLKKPKLNLNTVS